MTTKASLLDSYLRQEEFLLFDGAMGTMLQERGLKAGELPELLCLTHPSEITEIHKAYVDAGSMLVTTNTFGANRLKLGEHASVSAVFRAAVDCARKAHPLFVAADIGPIGQLLKPMGTLDFEDAYDIFAEQVRAAKQAGADVILIETMTDLLEAKAAVLAARAESDLPVFATMTFGEDGRSFLGTSPAIAARTLDALNVDALGINCSLGPRELLPLVEEMVAVTSKPIILQANAGLPSFFEGKTSYDISAREYTQAIEEAVKVGVSMVGGCCGTSPRYIESLAAMLKQYTPQKEARTVVDESFVVCSAQKEISLRNGKVALIGERINPTGKKRLADALRTQNFNKLVEEAVLQTNASADILDLNVGLPEIDEPATLVRAVVEIQGVCSAPLQLDSSDPQALERAARVYAGIPLLNSVNGSEESLSSILPIAAKYGCAVLGLTLNEQGIPSSAEDRLAIASLIVERAIAYGIPRNRIAIDCLVMAASVSQSEVQETLRACRLVKHELGVRTVLGVSNVSFGLPFRLQLNACFLAAAFDAGLDMPIANPLDARIAETLASWRVINGQDSQAKHFINANFGEIAASPSASGARKLHVGSPLVDEADAPVDAKSAFTHGILQGLKSQAATVASELLSEMDSEALINQLLIPALNEAGDRFEEGTFFLPQLMSAAEAAKAAFGVIREHHAATTSKNASMMNADTVSVDENSSTQEDVIVLATVKGDIHDIGKNIVRMLLENYGYTVIDLGRDVAPEDVLAAVKRTHARLVGLSALMTTTLKSMEETISLLRKEAKEVQIFVGGAVLNEEYARMVGADFYAKDAAESARIVARVLKENKHGE